MTLFDSSESDANIAELVGGELPATYRAAYLDRDDARSAAEHPVTDVRQSLKVGHVALPDIAPDEVVVAVMASALNYNTVWSALFQPIPTFAFLRQRARRGGWHARHDQPYHVVGSDAAGIVVRVGVAVSRWLVGDRVVVYPGDFDSEDPDSYGDAMCATDAKAWGFETNFGGLADLAVVKSTQLIPKPPHLTWEEAACNTLCAMTAYRMLVSPNGARMKQGDVVLVWGATGGLGSYAVQMIRNGGGIAVGVVSSANKARLLEALGCDVIIRRDLEGLSGLSGPALGKGILDVIRQQLDEDPHIVFEHTGRATFDASVYLVRPGGTVITCGSSSGFEHTFDNRYLWMRLKRIQGSHGATLPEAVECNRLITHGRIQPALTKVVSLDKVATAAHELQLNQHVGKIGVLCLAPREGLGIEDPKLRASIGEDRIRLFRQFASA